MLSTCMSLLNETDFVNSYQRVVIRQKPLKTILCCVSFSKCPLDQYFFCLSTGLLLLQYLHVLQQTFSYDCPQRPEDILCGRLQVIKPNNNLVH